MVKNVGLRLVSNNPIENYILQPTYKFLRKKCKFNKYAAKIGTGVISGVIHAIPFVILTAYESNPLVKYVMGYGGTAVSFAAFPILETYESFKHHNKEKKNKQSLEDKLNE